MLKYIHLNLPDKNHIDFPSGEKHIRVPDLQPGSDVVIDCRGGVTDIMKLAMVADICRRGGVGKMFLVLPFVPYARQDQVYVDGDPLSIKVFASLVNSLGFDRVVIVDPHSKVTEALFDRVLVLHQYQIVNKLIRNLLIKNPDVDIALVAPDLGAAKKVKQVALEWEQIHVFSGQQGRTKSIPVIQCDKTRDPATGKITGFRVLDGAGHIGGKHCLVVDDICDGGGTFLGLADLFDDALWLSLYVTHGIFSKGTDIILERYHDIFTTDSLYGGDDIHVLPLGDFIHEQFATSN